MKKGTRRLALGLALILLLGTAAMAANVNYVENTGSNLLTAALDGKCTLTADGDRLTVTYQDTEKIKSGDEILVLMEKTDAVTDDTAIPAARLNEDTITYIDQRSVTATDGKIEFTLLPSQLSGAVIYLSGGGFEQLTPVGLTKVKFKWGDVSGEGNVDIDDVIKIMLYLVSGKAITVPEAADVDGHKGIDINDVVALMQHLVNPNYTLPRPSKSGQ